MKLKTKFSKLRHDGHITDAEYTIIINVLNKFATQPCEDYVSREAVENITWEEPSYTDVLNVLTEVREKIRQLPSVTPKSETITDFADRCRECGAKHGELLKSKTGSWIVHPKGGCAHLVCSKCLSDAPFDCKTNFCPNCGSRMIEPQESRVMTKC